MAAELFNDALPVARNGKATAPNRARVLLDRAIDADDRPDPGVSSGRTRTDPTVELLKRPYHSVAKRFVDLVGAMIGLIVLAPVIVAVAVAVKCSSPGPVLFRQRRVGANGESFEILKFRTMKPDAEHVLSARPDLLERYLANNHKLEPRDDPRVTRLGRLLRRSSLDELPQLWNVLKGDMSLVGPRPILLTELDKYGPYASHYLSVRPGLTGAWQVSGRSSTSYERRVALDVDYIERWSVGRDLAILAKTSLAVITACGAY